MAYTPTAWVNDSVPTVDTEALKNAETQYQKVLDDAPKDDIAAVPSLRTLGPGAQQAAAGNHSH